jgi:hypothetical protein
MSQAFYKPATSTRRRRGSSGGACIGTSYVSEQYTVYNRTTLSHLPKCPVGEAVGKKLQTIIGPL